MTSSKPTSHPIRKILIIVFSVIVVILISASLYLYSRVNMPFPGSEKVRIYLPSGMTEPEIKDYFISTLGYDYGSRVFGLWEFFKGNPQRSRGSYVLHPGMKAYRAAKMIATGSQTPIKFTFNNIRLLPSLAGRAGRVFEADSAEFMNAIASVLSAKGYSKEEFPAAFLPNTYEFYWTTSAEDVIKELNAVRDRTWNNEREAKAQALGLTPNQVTTIASIVEEETSKADERPRIARLYINRIKNNMKLQADPTVKYAIGDFSIRRITGKHLAVESPYNTYQNIGLPPGPIRIPEISTIDAVLNAPEHHYLYMCAKDDFSGYHNFATDYATHMQNARRYQRALNARGIK